MADRGPFSTSTIGLDGQSLRGLLYAMPDSTQRRNQVDLEYNIKLIGQVLQGR